MLGTIFSSHVAATLASTMASSGVSFAAAATQPLSAELLAAMAPALRHAYSEAFTQALDRVLLVAAGVAGVGFILSWFIPEAPLRESVAAASSSVGKEAGEAFSMPAPSGDELLHGVAIIANRDVQRAYIQGIVSRAGVDLTPSAAWLLLRLQEEPALDIRELSRRNGLSYERLEAGLTQLRERRYLEAGTGRRSASFADARRPRDLRAPGHRAARAVGSAPRRLAPGAEAATRRRLATSCARAGAAALGPSFSLT